MRPSHPRLRSDSRSAFEFGIEPSTTVMFVSSSDVPCPNELSACAGCGVIRGVRTVLVPGVDQSVFPAVLIDEVAVRSSSNVLGATPWPSKPTTKIDGEHRPRSGLRDEQGRV